MTSPNLVQTNNQAGGPGSAPGSTLLQLRGLNVYYGESHILRDVDLSVAPGQMVCLIGRNGVGKTTLLKTVIGLLRQRSGSVQLDGRELSPLAPHQRARSGIGYVPQGREIIPQLTVRENLLLGLEALPGGLGKTRHIDPLVFDLFPILRQFLRRRGGDLSGGQQQQLAIGRALTARPRLLILDEPTEGIQPNVIKDIAKVIHHLARDRNFAIVLVEQYFEFARDLADTITVMVRGEVALSGKTRELDEAEVRKLLTV